MWLMLVVMHTHWNCKLRSGHTIQTLNALGFSCCTCIAATHSAATGSHGTSLSKCYHLVQLSLIILIDLLIDFQKTPRRSPSLRAAVA